MPKYQDGPQPLYAPSPEPVGTPPPGYEDPGKKPPEGEGSVVVIIDHDDDDLNREWRNT